MNFWKTAVAAALLVVLAPACKRAPEDETSGARAEERLNLVSNPGVYLRTVDHERVGDDDGAPVSEDQLTLLSVLNGSHFPVTDLAGDVLWLDTEDRRIGTTPFTLKGPIGPGTVRRFSSGEGSLSSGKLRAAASGVQIVFTRVRVVE